MLPLCFFLHVTFRRYFFQVSFFSVAATFFFHLSSCTLPLCFFWACELLGKHWKIANFLQILNIYHRFTIYRLVCWIFLSFWLSWFSWTPRRRLLPPWQEQYQVHDPLEMRPLLVLQTVNFFAVLCSLWYNTHTHTHAQYTHSVGRCFGQHMCNRNTVTPLEHAVSQLLLPAWWHFVVVIAPTPLTTREPKHDKNCGADTSNLMMALCCCHRTHSAYDISNLMCSCSKKNGSAPLRRGSFTPNCIRKLNIKFHVHGMTQLVMGKTVKCSEHELRPARFDVQLILQIFWEAARDSKQIKFFTTV